MLDRIIAITALNLRSLPARWGVVSVVVICMAGVAGVMVAMLAMAEGFQRTYTSSGRADRIIVLSTGENFEAGSSIARDQAATLLALPGVRRLADGAAAASLERYTVSGLKMRRTGTDANVVVRGVGAQVLAVRPEARITAGRMFTPGLHELVVGRGAQDQFEGLELGATVELSDVRWTVVGVFETGGSAQESETWGDVEVVLGAFKLSHYSSMTALLESESTFQSAKDFVTANPALEHTLMRETEYYAAQSGLLGTAMLFIGYLVAVIMALGAVFAAVNTMYASIESRSAEIGTLRALGFAGFPIVASVLLESIVLCAVGALLGGAIAWLVFNGHTVSTVSGASFSQIAFAFSVTPALLLQGVIWACAVGLLGGLPPAVRAARMPIVEALRAG